VLLHTGAAGIQLCAFAGGIGATLLVLQLSNIGGEHSLIRLVLAGVIINALAGAGVSLIKYMADPLNELPALEFWLMGCFNVITWKKLAAFLPIAVAGCSFIILFRRQLNILSLSEDEARSAGVNVSLMRAILIVASTVITASVISMCGQVGWVGLLVPHCARMLCGQNNRAVIPVSLLLGSALMIVIDTLARSLSASEIPISILTAIIGAPFFIVLLRRTGGAR